MVTATTPPPLPASASNPARPVLTAVLSLALLIFLSSGFISFFSDTLLLGLNRQDLAVTAALGSLVVLLTGFVLLCLMALIPGVPKRYFLPISLFLPVMTIAILPVLVYFKEHTLLIAWGLSLGQVMLGLFIVHRLHGGIKFCWPLFPERQLAGKNFSWGNLIGVVMMGLLLVLPALVLYTAFSAKLAVEHFTDGFVAVRPSGISMQVRNYVRNDGKKIMLVPMSHVGESEFYEDLAASFPPNSVILMEGVTDTTQLVNTHSDYSKMAGALGGVEQTKAFKPKGEIVAADMDMSQFSPATLDLLKTAMLLHAKGVTPETLPILMKPTPPGLENQLMDDILTKRNHHLLGVIQERLPTAEILVVPWGAAHMPEIHREIQKLGFHVVDTKEYVAIRFGS
jgi:hypothetical protein